MDPGKHSATPSDLGFILPFSNNLAFYSEQAILIKMLVVLSPTEHTALRESTAQGPALPTFNPGEKPKIVALCGQPKVSGKISLKVNCGEGGQVREWG